MKREPMRANRVVALICLAEVLSMTGFAAYAAFLPALRSEWGMSGAQAGFVSGAFFFGYMLAVPFLSGITDRIDARRVFIAACVLATSGTAGFAWLAEGMLSGGLCQALTGAGLAGTFMPGLKALTDRVEGPRQARYIAFYTASFSIATSFSLLAAGWLAALLPWRLSFLVLALGPLLAAPLIWAGLSAKAPLGGQDVPWFPRFGVVLAQRQTRRYILGYVAHCWELFGVRSWLVAFLVFAYAINGSAVAVMSPTEAAALINLFGLPASILGNEAAGKLGRPRWIAGVMLCSGLLCWLVGFSASWPWWLMLALLAVYFTSVMSDSASLTAGMVQATPPEQRGAAMAVYSLSGFGAAFLSPMFFGVTLDLAGGANSPLAWTLAFGLLGAGGLIWAAWRPAPETKTSV
jgi:MFS family permease